VEKSGPNLDILKILKYAKKIEKSRLPCCRARGNGTTEFPQFNRLIPNKTIVKRDKKSSKKGQLKTCKNDNLLI
jgi:hypothetical protein